MIGITFFWFLGALIQLIILSLGPRELHVGEAATTALATALAVGIGAGSLLASPQQLHLCAIRSNLPVWQEAEELVVSW